MSKFSLECIDKSLFIYQTNKTVALVHPQPFLKYHIVILNSSCKKSVDDLNQEEMDDVFLAVELIGKVLDEFGEGFTVLFKEHEDVLAVHLVVRNPGDLEKNDEIYEEGALYLADFKEANEEIKERAAFLREKIKVMC